MAARRHMGAGDQHFAAGRYPEAVLEYRLAVDALPLSGEARRKLADTYWRNGEERQAIGQYIRAADLLPDDRDLQIRAAEALILGERFEDAHARVEPILKADPGNVGALLVRANALAGLRNLKGAIAELESLIDRDPARSEPYVNLGLFRLAHGDRAEAEVAFTNAVTLAPEKVAPRLARAHFYFATARHEQAVQDIRTLLSVDPRHELANRTLAAFLTVSGRAAEAVPFLRTAAEVSGSRDSWLRLADLYVTLQRPDEAIGVLNTLLDRPDAFTIAKLRLARIELDRGRSLEARVHIDDVLARDPRNVQGLVTRARWLLSQNDRRGAIDLLTELAKTQPEDPDVYFTLGVAHFESQRWTPALEAFAEVISRDPRSAAAHAYIGRIELTKRDAAAAINAANSALAAGGDSANAHAVLVRGLIMQKDLNGAGTVLERWRSRSAPTSESEALRATLALARNRPRDARAAYDRALVLDPDNIEARAGLVDVALAEGQPAMARTVADNAVARNPQSASVHMLAARTAMRLGDAAGAERALRRAIDLDENSLDAYGLLGSLYVKESRLEEARQEFEQIAQRQTRPISAFTLIGTVYEAQRKPVEAEQAYLKALQIDPRAAVAANNLAWIYAIGQRQLDTALNLAQVAKEELSANAHVDDTLGWVQYQRGQYLAAVTSLIDSVRQRPENAAYRFRLGMALYKANELAQARVQLTRALQIQPDFEGAIEARRALQAMNGK